MQKLFSALILLAGLSHLNWLAAQPSVDFPNLGIGEWRQHLPWQRAFYVTQNAQKVYFSTEWAVVEIDKEDHSPRFLTKVEGLSDAGMGLIRFNTYTNRLFITYSNSNIDIWSPDDNSVVNLPYITKNINLTGDKTIYNVCFENEFVYLACGFGVMKIDMQNAEVVFTTFTSLPIRSVATYDGFLYAGSAEGLFRIPLSDVNPEDFSRWQMMGPAQGFSGADNIGPMQTAFGKLFVGIDTTLYQFNGLVASAILNASGQENVQYLSAEGDGLLVGWKKGFSGRISYLESNGASQDIQNGCDAGKPLYAVEDGHKKFWIADDSDEFRYYDANIDQCNRFQYNSPYLQETTEIEVVNNVVYVATPGFDINLNALYKTQGIYIFKEGLWQRFSGASNPEIQAGDCHRDLWRVAPHPSQDKFYAGSFVGGLVEAVDFGAETQCYTQYNSALQNAGQSGSNRTAIGGLAFDDDNNLWISNYDAAAPIAVLKPDGSIRNFSAAPANNLLQVAVDKNGYKWFVVGFNGGLLVYDSGSDLDSPSDDRYRLLSTSNSVLPTNTVNCVAVDLDGDVWVGTSQGVISFECGSSVFDASLCKGSRRVANVDDFGAYLLANQDVRTIAVDGANRKWFGTTNGIFVQSPTGEIPVARFTDTNSPLFDNLITDIAINQSTGEVWIGTDKGLQSYRSDAVAGRNVNHPKPYAYPNPVRPDYDGPIAIYGLARDANVKITDIAGHLVYEGTALGGQAVWDGRDYLGRRAASGVYLIYATSSENFEAPDAVIAKVVILN